MQQQATLLVKRCIFLVKTGLEGSYLRNRYCINSNLNEEQFLFVIKLWCRNYSVSKATNLAKRWSSLFSQPTISRQSISRYFIALGDRLWEPVEKNLGLVWDAWAWTIWYYVHVDPQHEDSIFKEVLLDHQAYYISSDFFPIFRRVRKQSISSKGIPLKRFTSHLGRVFYLWGFEDKHRRKSFEWLSGDFEQYPLNFSTIESRYMEQVDDRYVVVHKLLGGEVYMDYRIFVPESLERASMVKFKMGDRY
ncbi:hypothetical protein P886_4176 [Alteromonadaceae bacterium 2753L.S.0a.02]|nr:hypothetical protein P886_4176 [Alteromonadaceae bacterium 2753L.S.0a.02]